MVDGWARQLVDRCENRAALRMSQDNDEPRAVPFGCEFDTADLRRGDDLAGAANDEQIAETLVDYNFRREARVRASKDDRNWLLAVRDFGAARLACERGVAAHVGHETAIARTKAIESRGG